MFFCPEFFFLHVSSCSSSPSFSQMEPKRLKKQLPKILRLLKPDDRILIVGTTQRPFDAELQSFCKVYQKIILVPRPDYASRFGKYPSPFPCGVAEGGPGGVRHVAPAREPQEHSPDWTGVEEEPVCWRGLPDWGRTWAVNTNDQVVRAECLSVLLSHCSCYPGQKETGQGLLFGALKVTRVAAGADFSCDRWIRVSCLGPTVMVSPSESTPLSTG